MKNKFKQFLILAFAIAALSGRCNNSDNMLVISRVVSSQNIECALDKAIRQPISTVNWAEFSYAPKVEFASVHSGDTLYLKYYVTEDCTMALQGSDNGQIWTDSCVEFFVCFDGVHYYNFEFNCIGKALMSRRKSRTDAVAATLEQLSAIKRYASLGVDTFAERKGDNSWTLMVAIPVSLFFDSALESLNGVKATANFYKCGDNLSKPHFLSWNPIAVEKPDFHQPKYFGNIIFE